MMSAQTHDLIQGSQDWLDYRKNHFNASDAAAMLGLSPYKSRDALLEEMATGNTKPIDAMTQRIFDEGHRLEAAARPIAEEIVGEELYSPTMSKEVEGMKLSASFDGLTMLDDIAWEHKTLNKSLSENIRKGIVPELHKPQLEQQLLVSCADKVLFMASNDNEECHIWYESEPLLRKRLIAGWKQFANELESWEPKETKLKVVAQTIDELPALNIEIEGGVKRTNLEQYEKTALAFIQNINTDLQTDSDFANADAMVKFCTKTEKDLEYVKKAALEQTADISTLFKTIDTLKEEMRSKRLELNKLVKARKEAIKLEIVNEAKAAFTEHVKTLNKRVPEVAPIYVCAESFDMVVKNKRTVESLRNAVNTELANLKIESSAHADLCEENIKALKEIAGDYVFLFRDLKEIVTKDKEDLINLAKQRIADHEESEKKRIEAEREKIHLEEEAKAKLEAEHEAAAEKDRNQGKTFNPDNYPTKAAANRAAHEPQVETEQLILSCNSDDIQDVIQHLSTKYLMTAQADGLFSVERY